MQWCGGKAEEARFIASRPKERLLLPDVRNNYRISSYYVYVALVALLL